MPAYDELPPHVQKIVDEKAEAMAARLRISIEDARESIAMRVVTTSWLPSHGTGH
jgi:TRAP-type C4-dicarboxylate transport system substrate-binding protein